MRWSCCSVWHRIHPSGKDRPPGAGFTLHLLALPSPSASRPCAARRCRYAPASLFSLAIFIVLPRIEIMLRLDFQPPENLIEETVEEYRQQIAEGKSLGWHDIVGESLATGWLPPLNRVATTRAVVSSLKGVTEGFHVAESGCHNMRRILSLSALPAPPESPRYSRGEQSRSDTEPRARR
jgi:hypothetical protein